MSKTIDEKVVSMQFDNGNFERNVQTSLGTLDKLKNSLKFDGASKGFSEISAAAGKCDMSSLGNGLETVKTKFSALQVMGVTALANIANSAVDAGKRLVSAFTIDPIKSGFAEYELKMGSIQTIMASTGESLETVNGYLNELNEYSDKTIYSFSDMTQNIGKFTNAGVKLEDAVMAIKGISNEAAVSGANANEASRAMYNFAQALSAGYVKLIDWKSIENANMATVEFKQELINSAVAVGTLTETTDGYVTTSGTVITATKNFNDSLQDQWMTTDVLVGTLKDYADETTDIGKKAFASAQDVKTFTMMMDTLKESAQSGWAATWEIIVGDFEEAKSLWTNLSEVFGNVISKVSEIRNSILESALGRNFKELGEKIKGITDRIKEVTEPAKQVVETAKDLGDVVNKVLLGSFGDGKDRFDALTEAGANYYEVQNKVNETLNNSHRYTEDQIAAQDKLLGISREVTDAQNGEVEVGEKLSDVEAERIESLTELTDAQLENLGYTKEQIGAIRELKKQADKLGIPIKELIENIDKIDGRWILLDSFKNLASALSEIGKAVGEAWRKIFYGDATDEEIIQKKADSLYNLIAAFHKFSEVLLGAVGSLDDADSSASKIKRTLEGLFAVVDIIRTVIGGVFGVAFKLVGKVLEQFNLDILDVTASIGDALVKFRDWVLETGPFAEGIEVVAEKIAKVITTVRDWIKAFIELPKVQKWISEFKQTVSDVFSKLREYFSGGGKVIGDFIGRIKDMDSISLENIGKALRDFKDNVLGYFISGIKDAFTNKFPKISEYLSGGIEKIKEFIDRIKNMDSISLDDIVNIFKDFKDNVLDYFLDIDISFDGFKTSLENIKETIVEKLGISEEKFDSFIQKIKDFIELVRSKIPSAVAIGLGALLIRSISKISDVIETLAGPLGGITKIFESLAGGLTAIAGYVKANAFKTTTVGIRNIAISIAILALSIALLTKIDQSKMWNAVLAIGALTVAMAALAAVAGLVGKITGLKTAAVSLLALAGSMIVLVIALKMMEGLDGDKVWKNVAVLGAMAVGLAAIAAILGKVTPTLSKGSISLIAMAVALGLLVGVLWVLDKMDLQNVGKSLAILLGLIVTLGAMAKLCSSIKFTSGLGILALVLALQMMVGVLENIADMDYEKVKNNTGALVLVFGSLLALMVAARIGGAKAGAAGIGILAITVALLLIVKAIKDLAEIDASTMKKASDAVAKILLVFAAIVALSYFAGKNAIRAGAMLLLMAGAMLILAGVIHLLKDIEPEGLDRAVEAISQLMIIFGLIIASTGLAKNCTATLIIITVAIGLMAAALYLLSGLDPAALKTAANSLSQVMIIFGLLLASTKLIDTENWGKKLATIGVMTLVVAALAGILYMLSKCEVGSTLEVATSLSLLLLSISASCAILGTVGKLATKALPAALAVTGIVAILALILLALTKLDVGPTLEIAASLSLLLLSLSAACLILAAVGTIGAGPALIGALALDGVIVVVGALMVAIGALVDKIPALETFLDKGIVVLEKIGYGLGSFVGNIIGGFAAGATDGLPKIGENISSFMENASISDDVVDGIKNMAEAILLIAGAGFIDSILSFLSFGNDPLDKFSEQLPKFGEAINGFYKAVSNDGSIDINAIDVACAAGKKIAEMAAALPNEGGWLETIMGGNSMSSIAPQMEGFGKAIYSFYKAVSGDNAIELEAVTNACEAAKTIANAASELPNEGGWLETIMGGNSMDTVATQFGGFGRSIVAFYKAVSGDNAIDLEAVNVACDSARAIANAASELPNEGGWLEAIMGGNSMDTVATQFGGFGSSIASFYKAVSGDNSIKLEAVNIACDAAIRIANAAAELPSQGGWLDKIFGTDNSISTVASQFGDFGEAISAFSKAVSGDNAIDRGAVDTALSTVRRLVDVAKNLPAKAGFGENDLTSFGDDVKGFGGKLAKFSESLTDVDTGKLSEAITQANRVFDLLTQMEGFDASGATEFADGLESIGNAGVDDFIEAFTDAEPRIKTAAETMMTSFNTALKSKVTTVKLTFTELMAALLKTITDRKSQFTSAGSNLMTAFKTSFSSGASSIKTTLNSTMLSCVSALRSYTTSFNSVGKQLAQGLANGISANTYAVTAKANAMGLAAANAAKASLRIKSPSKVFYEIGEYAGQGLVNALSAYETQTYKAGYSIAESASTGLGNGLSKVQEVIELGDSVTPTVRPVLDMSNMQVRELSLSSSLDASLIRPVESLSQIVSDAQAKIDASNNRVINAISELREDLSNYYSGDGAEVALYVDSKKLATSIAKPMNRQLNILSKQGGY